MEYEMIGKNVGVPKFLFKCECSLNFRTAGSAAAADHSSERRQVGDAVQVHPLQPDPDADFPHTLPQRLQRAAGSTHWVRQNCGG